MNGELVVVKEFTGRAKLLKVCYANSEKVFVTSDRVFTWLKSGKCEMYPIGFSTKDVFCYNGEKLSDHINWSKMKHWSESRKA